jgi:carbon monoxide dehydrogenase subunit G
VRFEGRLRIGAPIDAVYAFLIDPTRAGPCGPGVESVERQDEDRFVARAKVGVGVVSARFVCRGECTEREAPHRAVIRVRGQAPGSALDALAEMNLRVDGDATLMDWHSDVTVSGLLASVGSRLIASTADRLIGQAFDCIRARLEGESGGGVR